MNINNNIKKTKAFSLIEVLIFITILSLFFIVAVSVMIVSLRASKINEHKILAKHYAEELYEWLRAEKEENWGGYSATYPGSDPETFTYKATKLQHEYCFLTSPIVEWSSPANFDSCSYSLNNGIFRRYVILTAASPDANSYINEVKAEIVVDWEESGVTYSVPINSTFSIWEKIY